METSLWVLSMRFDMPVAVNVGSVSCNSAVENSLLRSRSLVAKGEIISTWLLCKTVCSCIRCDLPTCYSVGEMCS